MGTKLILWLVLVVVVAGCSYRYHEASSPAANTDVAMMNHRCIDSAITLLRDGDLVLRTGNDVTSFMFAQTNKHDKTYSHCGLVRVEHGYPFVYHAIGGEDNPDEFLRRDSAAAWFSPVHNLGFGIARYSLDSVQKKRLLQAVILFYKERRRFDMQFDLSSDDRLYCAELVYKALNQATGKAKLVQPEQRLGYNYVSIEHLYRQPSAKLVWQVRFK